MTKLSNLKLLFIIILIVFSSLIGEEIILIIEALFVFVFVLVKAKEIYFDRVMKYFVILMVVILIHSIITYTLFQTEVVLIAKQIVGISVSFMFYYLLLQNEKPRNVLEKYVNIAVFISIVAIIQEFGYLLKITPLYSYGFNLITLALSDKFLRATAFFQEPSFLAYFLIPAFAYVLFYSKEKFWNIENIGKLIAITIGLVLSFSSVAILGILGCGLVKILQIKDWKVKIVMFLFIISFLGVAIEFNDSFSMRIMDTLDVFLNGGNSKANLSTVAFYINYNVSMKSMISTGFLGIGIGNCAVSYDRYYNLFTNGFDPYYVSLELNRTDANSMLFRIISEFGIIGLIFVFTFLYKMRKSEDKQVFCSLLMYILVILLRQGHYFNQGFYFYVVLLIVNYFNMCLKENTHVLARIERGQQSDYC